ncbi:hypothetical protein [Bradyrhizobium sp. Tv2a-2]|uniref:hypothetical protein n=1 Tax=Bradyrhizobium sp. Tv2a-2 TaxID=113395 RepID=UPI00040E6B9A|nr:hypothetical protein [Bradyrhizobium sp. Tv2a-2]
MSALESAWGASHGGYVVAERQRQHERIRSITARQTARPHFCHLPSARRCSTAEIASITGHSLKEVDRILQAHYLGGKFELAVQAMRKRENREQN